ncbi:putative nucleotide-diphospho-sugar transferase [Dendronalium sp. ChiSLP03b]|uniref:putative nucleotide-diphospho-sugar transferase n=1 Tax=Dendronalium sp. ChiSLP03b TaxID=3075381 RepID=UPI002AD391DD|nr:putative nucleotide-diphospho-sugar transferase [Dendronalium sp. ChiSLP03b]MDZ8206074.1 putative nucleotide-diphospho-sugar transferase [Dendronalium sp. ChiSLP03b]
MTAQTRGFITILTGLYSFQDCIHFLAAIRKFHQEPIIILIDHVPKILYPFLKVFKNVILKPAPADQNTVLASRQAKLALYAASEFDKTIYLDSDICLLSNINDVFEYLEDYDFLLTEDVQPSIPKATNLLRGKQQDMLSDVLPILQSVGLPLREDSVQYNGGFMAFRKTEITKIFFDEFKHYFEIVKNNQDKLLLKDQGAFASAIASVKPKMKILSPAYNYLSKWKDTYKITEEIKVLHCTYPYRPQYAKNITRSLYTRIFDKFAKVFLPNQVTNPWRTK